MRRLNSLFQIPQIISLIALSSLAISSCKAPTPSNSTSQVVRTNSWPPVTDALRCLAQTGPIISQHRGRSRETSAADNSLSGLKALRKDGFIMAEIDVARLKDGTHILFHDGVMDDASTGKGPVASVNLEQAEKLLLVNKRGQVTSDRIMTVSELADWADARLYLEIDFKSSANERGVIRMLEEAGMGEHIILIAYSRKQALRLHGYAPNALIAAPVSKIGDIRAYEISGLPRDKILAWLGTKAYKADLAEQLSRSGVLSSYGMLSPKYAKRLDYSDISMVVTDYAHESKGVIGIRQKDSDRLADCGL